MTSRFKRDLNGAFLLTCMNPLWYSPICEDLLPQQELIAHEATCSGPQASTSNLKTPSFRYAKPARGGFHKRKASIFDVKGKATAPQDGTDEVDQIRNTVESGSKRFKTSTALERAKPLPERVRPKTLDEVVGQSHLLARGALLRSLMDKDAVGQYPP